MGVITVNDGCDYCIDDKELVWVLQPYGRHTKYCAHAKLGCEEARVSSLRLTYVDSNLGIRRLCSTVSHLRTT